MSKKFIAKLSRWLHIYLSMISFIVVLFFSITGLTLNHADYFQKNIVVQNKGLVKKNWVDSKDTLKIQKLAIVEYFRTKYQAKGVVADFRIYDNEISFSFKSPGYAADAFINRSDATYTLTETKQGFIGFMNDLHKGRDTGSTWLWVIDISSILMTIVSVTGLILLLFLKKKRLSGLLLLLLGLIAVSIIYHYWGQ
ncbi:MAG: hypothetical protein RL542_726 [Bacteroidota bacterium]|jgi:hypothetical protein